MTELLSYMEVFWGSLGADWIIETVEDIEENKGEIIEGKIKGMEGM
jgi:hypothetical protein